MSTPRYEFRPLNSRARGILPKQKIPGALPTTPADSTLTAADDTPELAPGKVARTENPALRTVRSFDDAVRASSPWRGPRVPKETSTEQVSVGDTPVISDNKSVEDVNELLNSTLPPAPGVAGPDSESDESDDDGRPWITVRRKNSREGTRPKSKGQNNEKANLLSDEQSQLVREAKRRMTDEERDRVNRRRSTVDSRAETESLAPRHAGPSKGKATDPREWGAAGISDEELDADAQCVELDAWNAAKAAADASDADTGETSTEKATP